MGRKRQWLALAAAALVLVPSAAAQTEQQKLNGRGGFHYGFGNSVAIDGDTALVGEPYADVVRDNTGWREQGVVQVFVRSGGVWRYQWTFESNNGDDYDHFGSSVAISGNTAVVGAPTDEVGSNTNQGTAYVFVRSGTTWTQQAQLITNNGDPQDYFGNAVALDGDTAVVGADQDEVGANTAQGTAYVFVWSGTAWTQ